MQKYLDYSDEVRKALDEGKPVVALESTIISHGMPYPKNVETALMVEDEIRKNGAVPATIAIINGRLKAGLTKDEIEYFGKKGTAITKTSRRDIPTIISRKADGATTVAATMIIASLRESTSLQPAVSAVFTAGPKPRWIYLLTSTNSRRRESSWSARERRPFSICR